MTNLYRIPGDRIRREYAMGRNMKDNADKLTTRQTSNPFCFRLQCAGADIMFSSLPCGRPSVVRR